MDQIFDVAIIGGGINGCGCAADAALRGLSVALFEKDDLASKTSSSSTKLIHGGLRYLENYEFSMVQKALNERQRLLRLAPHLVQPQAFVLPYQNHMRSALFLRLGLFFYDHLSRKNHLPKCKYINRKQHQGYFIPLLDTFKRGFLFYDASTDDARLTVCNALQAKKYGATIKTNSKLIQAKVENNLWHLTIQPQKGSSYTVQARSLINATGPWVNEIASLTRIPTQKKMSLIKGSHIVVPSLYKGTHAYFLQHSDKRIVFVIPYHDYCMIGTTDIEFTGSLDKVEISDDEIHYLIQLVNSYFRVKLRGKDDIIDTWSGVRPLLAEEGKELKSISRDYYFEHSSVPAPIITIYGGKITTYRQLAEDVVDQLKPQFPDIKNSTTKNHPLPGAEFESMSFDDYLAYASKKYDWMNHNLLKRYLFSYGSQLEQFAGKCSKMSDLGTLFGDTLYQAEVDYLVHQEWARSCDDILKRRTKLGLSLDESNIRDLATYIEKIIPAIE